MLAVFAVFGQTAGFEFINYDDNENVYANPVVDKGLSVKAVGWAFTHPQVYNWVPLTTLSHMLDCQVFGLRAGGHHLVNVLWHAANAVLLFLVLRQMTGSQWRSAFAAAVFALHPLRVESVAWVSERKDVLSGFFFMLAIGAYVRNVRRPAGIWRAAVFLSFALGLLAKSMVATLPFVLLLLDYWPLGRWHNPRQFLHAVLEKVPLFALSAGSCVATALVPGLLVKDSQTVHGSIGNALASYLAYLRQMIFPSGLAVPYPNAPGGQPAWNVGLALLLLVALSAGVIARRDKWPYLLTGWLWFLGMLLPVIGIIPISYGTAHADRYTYLPGIGLAIAGTWAVGDWSSGWKHRRVVLGGLMAAIIGALMVLSRLQTGYWRNSESLWRRALACTSANSLAHYNLGKVLAQQGKDDEAITEYRQVLSINPGDAEALFNLGVALAKTGHLQEAVVEYQKTLAISPNNAAARNNLGNALANMGNLGEATAQYRQALEIVPGYLEAHINLGLALTKQRQLAEAAAEFQKALAISPNNVTAHINLGDAMAGLGNLEEAVAQYRQTLAIKPDQFVVQNNLAWLLATAPSASLRNGAQAVALAERASQLSGGANPAVLRTLAAAYAEAGRYTEATATARRALALALEQNNTALAGKLQEQIKLYEGGTPLRQPK